MIIALNGLVVFPFPFCVCVFYNGVISLSLTDV